MTAPPEPQHSLFTALENARGESLASDNSFRKLPEKFLAPDEFVHLALEGEGWSYIEPLLLVTDRRLLRLREGVLGFWRKRGELPASDIIGVSLRPRLFLGRVLIRTRGSRTLRASYRKEESARRFVDGLSRLIDGRR